MPFRSFVLALIALLSAAPLAHAAVGFRHLNIPDPAGPPIEIGVWYPTGGDAAVEGADLPLVVMSHGTGDHFAGHRDTAVALAQAGFVVAALTHTQDNFRDQTRAVEVWDRPRQLKVLVDYMLGAWPDHDRIDPRRVGAFGFSAGGFTVLAAAGGEPDLSRTTQHCKDHPDHFGCRLTAGKRPSLPPGFTWTHDDRIKAIVVAAPALGYTFDRAGLAKVRQPMQLWRAENDTVLPHPYYAEAVRLALPTPPEFHLVRNADHFDFLPPCSPELAKHAPQICRSAEGFDRTAFHEDFNRQVTAFFRRTLAPRP